MSIEALFSLDPWFFLYLFLGINGALVTAFFIARFFQGFRVENRRRRAQDFLHRLTSLSTDSDAERKKARKFFLAHKKAIIAEFMHMEASITLPPESRTALVSLIMHSGVAARYVRMLGSPLPHKRKEAAWFFAALREKAYLPYFVKRLKKEKKEKVKLVLCWVMLEFRQPAAIPEVLDALYGSSPQFKDQLIGLLSTQASDIIDLFPILKDRSEKEMIQLLIHLAGELPSDFFSDYLVDILDAEDEDIRRQAFLCLAKNYPGHIEYKQFIIHPDHMIRNLAVEAMADFPGRETIEILYYFIKDDSVHKSVILALSNILSYAPRFFPDLQQRFINTTDPVIQERLGEVLSARMELYFLQIEKMPTQEAQRFFQLALEQGKTSPFIVFLSSNQNIGIENRILGILGTLTIAEDVKNELRMYLDPRILARLEWKPLEIPVKRETTKKDEIRQHFALIYLGLAILGPVTIFILLLPLGDSWPFLASIPWSEWGVKYLQFMVLFFGVYALALNCIYALLLIVSFFTAHRQNASFRQKPLSFLFRQGVLPSVSILAPAYNEEATIIESVNSLLNLRYPDYEVIVINDGSGDSTLKTVVTHFGLEKKDVFVHEFLRTEKIRGIYTSPRYPELLVVDKMNGGKADSLNTGLNIARKDYFAGIDSDSLLERDALLKLAATILDREETVVAAGGNIMPINGCEVHKGLITRIGVPRDLVPLWQTVEYIRAFMTGRLGWAGLRSLLIISGAFGLFHKKSVIDMSGYLTSNEKYAKDTVGEDMELVVRLIRDAGDKHKKIAVSYAFNANCWTEVPGGFSILRRQRDRWQRGLIDIITFHRQMFLRPKYGSPGTLAFPYFLIFEILGPWFEMQGLIALIIGIALGLLQPVWLSFVLTNYFLGGVAVSIAALFIAEREHRLFSFGGSVAMLFATVTESLFYRPANLYFRLAATYTILAKKGGWGKMTRKGFAGQSKKKR